MFENTTRIVAENLTRAVDRRTFLKRASQATMAGLMALAAGHGLAGRANATRLPGGGSGGTDIPAISCSPPGPYCNTGGGNLSGCHGGHCFQHLSGGVIVQCHVYYQYYQAGCWTTASGGGYWTCCDCQCTGGATCGCAQFNMTGQPPPPLPDAPGGGKGN